MSVASDSRDKPIIKAEKNVIRKKITQRDIEKWEVAQLDSNIEPKSKPSDIFEKLEEKRRIRHENSLQKLARSLYEVNLKTEKNITISSAELKACCKEFANALDEILISINNPNVATYCGSVFVQLQNQANGYKYQQQHLVNELHEDLIKFENERAKENEIILREACEEIRKIGYFLPYEVQTFVEHEALKMNKLSLNNRRCYEDLKLTLTLITEQTYKTFVDRVFCIRDSWIEQKSQEKYYNSQVSTEKRICKVVAEDYTRMEIRGEKLPLQMFCGNQFCMCTGEDWTKNVQRALNVLNTYRESVVEIYKKILNAIYKGLDRDPEELAEEVDGLEKDLPFEARIIKTIMFSVPGDVEKEYEEMEAYWQHVLMDLKEHFIYLNLFILGTVKLWQSHAERICESKKLILKVLEQADSNNEPVIQDLEIKLNLALDALRQEHVEAKMEKAHETAVDILNSLKEKYESMYLEDVSTVEDFYKMMTLESDVLSADIREFIYEIRPIDPSRIVHGVAERIRYLVDESPIVTAIEICFHKVHALKTMVQGIWVALETLSKNTREALVPRAESWIATKIENLAAKRTMQLELLNKRIERVRIEIYEKRLSEIRQHQQLLTDHQEKIQFVLKKVKEEFQNLLARESTKLDYVTDNLKEIEQRALLENFPGVLRGTQLTMERRKEDLENDIKTVFERFRADCGTKIFDMQQANINFMKSIKFFHENGNYSSEEGKMQITALETVDRDLNAELKNLLKESSKEESDFFKKVGAMFNPVIALFGLLHEETSFLHEVEQEVRNFTEEIREEAKTLTIDFEFLAEQCYCLCTAGKLDPYSYEQFWNFVIELLYRNVRRLLYPVELPVTPGESETSEEKEESHIGESSDNLCCCRKKFSVKLSPSKLTFHRQPAKDRTFTCKDYRDQLFNCSTPPENDGTFMAAMRIYFWEEMDLLQRTACDFYRKLQGRKIIREDLIANNYDAFATDILTKFKYYNAQIQQLWLQIILDFLPLLGRIKTLANSFLEGKLSAYRINVLKSLENFENTFSSCVETRMCENMQELQDLDKKLMPLHGYPQNVDLLNLLEKEVVQKTANQKIQWENLIKKFMNEIKCFRVLHVQQRHEINKIGMIHLKLQDTIFVNDLSDRILDKLFEHCDGKKFCMKKKSSKSLKDKESGEVESLASWEVPTEHKLGIVLQSKNLHSVGTYLTQLKHIIERERASGKPDSCPPCPEGSWEDSGEESICQLYCKPKLNILLEIVDLKPPINELMITLDDYIRNLKAFAKSQLCRHEEELYKWLEKWKYNVQKVLNLYSIMHEEKRETPVETRVLQPSVNLSTGLERTT